MLPDRGYNIGVRLIEDFLARTGLGRCKDFSEVGEVMAKVRPHLLPRIASLISLSPGRLPLPPWRLPHPRTLPRLGNTAPARVFAHL